MRSRPVVEQFPEEARQQATEDHRSDEPARLSQARMFVKGSRTSAGASQIPWLNQNTLLNNGMAAKTRPARIEAGSPLRNQCENAAGKQNRSAGEPIRFRHDGNHGGERDKPEEHLDVKIIDPALIVPLRRGQVQESRTAARTAPKQES